MVKKSEELNNVNLRFVIDDRRTELGKPSSWISWVTDDPDFAFMLDDISTLAKRILKEAKESNPVTRKKLASVDLDKPPATTTMYYEGQELLAYEMGYFICIAGVVAGLSKNVKLTPDEIETVRLCDFIIQFLDGGGHIERFLLAGYLSEQGPASKEDIN